MDSFLSNQHEVEKVSFGNLQPFTLYTVCSLQKTSTTYNGNVINGVKANCQEDEDFKFYTFLPKLLVNNVCTDEFIAAANQAFKDKNPIMVAYYGSVGSEFKGKFHKHGEGIDEKFKARAAKLAAMVSPMKHPAPQASEPPSKIVKLE